MVVNIENLKLKQLLPLNDYGKGDAKSFDQLMAEIESGDTQIIWQNNRPIRLLRIVYIRVRCREEILVENRQEFPDGRVRNRSHKGLSEKLHIQEAPDAGVYRALREELGFTLDELKDVPIQFLNQESVDKESPSYPGLMSRYNKLEYEVNLPDHLYRSQYVELSDDSGMRTYFVWERNIHP